MLMGGTRFSRNVGASVGMLYFVNTLGSAFACLICARFLMRLMGESGSVAVAASLNTTVGSIALLVSLAASRRAPDANEVAEENEAGAPATGGKFLPFPLALGAAVYAGTIRSRPGRAALVGGAAALAAAGAFAAGPLFDTVYERMLFKTQYRAGYRFAHLLESKFGVVAVGPDGTVFGGGVYDGRFHTSLVNDTNMLLRAYAISAFHPAPREVLMVGLASGSWAQVIANNPSVDHLTIVEIEPDYLDLIPRYPAVASIMHNPKVAIEIDDGRRWLFRNADRKFDLIVMNTTFNWRAHATNLLSVEFLGLIRQRLRPGGVFYYNTTYSDEVLLTGVTQFPYALRVLNFLALSDRRLTVDKEAWRRTLVSYRLDGVPVFDLSRQLDRTRLEEVLATADSLGAASGAGSAPMEYAPTIRVRCRGKRIITDDNMGTEWDLN